MIFVLWHHNTIKYSLYKTDYDLKYVVFDKLLQAVVSQHVTMLSFFISKSCDVDRLFCLINIFCIFPVIYVFL